MPNDWKKQRNKAQNQGETALGKTRGPNTGAWEKVFSGWQPGSRSKYTRKRNSGYNGPGKGTW